MGEAGPGGAADPAPPLVDAHAHIFTRAMPFAADAHSRPDYDYGVEAYLADLDRHGIRYGVIAAASLYGDYNDYTLEALANHDRLRGTVILDPATPAAELHRLASQGVAGVRLQWRRMSEFPDLTAPPYAGFLRGLADAGMHVELLSGSASLPRLLPPLVASGVDIVIDHFGVPARDTGAQCPGYDALARAVDSGRCWIKISAGFRMAMETAQAVAARLLADAGPERLLWGSDAPFVNHEASMSFGDALDLYYRLVPDAAIRRTIDETARTLFFGRQG